MKKLLYTLLLVFGLSGAANAQFLDNIYGGAALGYANPVGNFSEFAKGGVTWTVQAGYKITDRLSAGLEYSSAAVVGIDTTGNSGIGGISAYGLGGYLIKAHYRFTDGNLQPFAGVGLGAARVLEPASDISVGATRVGFGANIELGIKLFGAIVSYSFNVNGKTPEEPVFNVGSADLGVNYHRFSIGYCYNF